MYSFQFLLHCSINSIIFGICNSLIISSFIIIYNFRWFYEFQYQVFTRNSLQIITVPIQAWLQQIWTEKSIIIQLVSILATLHNHALIAKINWRSIHFAQNVFQLNKNILKWNESYNKFHSPTYTWSSSFTHLWLPPSVKETKCWFCKWAILVTKKSGTLTCGHHVFIIWQYSRKNVI
jgi:hypothetical protein